MDGKQSANNIIGMKRLIAISVFVFSALCSITMAVASDNHGRYQSMGQGSQSCGHFIASLQNDEQYQAKLAPLAHMVYKAWLVGYLTAINIYVNDTYSISGSTDLDGAFQWTIRYCNEHPEETYGDAAQQLTKILSPNRIRNAEDK